MKLYYASMAERFPELRLCALDWKADMVATVYYSPWRKTWLKKQEREHPANGVKRVPEEPSSLDPSLPKKAKADTNDLSSSSLAAVPVAVTARNTSVK